MALASHPAGPPTCEVVFLEALVSVLPASERLSIANRFASEWISDYQQDQSSGLLLSGQEQMSDTTMLALCLVRCKWPSSRTLSG